MTPYDYSSLTKSQDGISNTWQEIYVASQPLSWNLLSILEQTIYLPHDFYDIITAYFLLPSALCRVIPYLFLHGQSGSGKSTVAKIASYLHGISINSSSDTFAGIRNSLDARRKGCIELPHPTVPGQTYKKEVVRNTCMVWDDINAQTFTSQPNLYNMLKFGTDKSTSKITLSSKEVGENLEFECFCPKIFSSITPLHLDDRFRELKRRLIVVPCSRVEELTDERKAELGIFDDSWQGKLLDLTAYNWKGFSECFQEFWDLEMAQMFLATRSILPKSVKGLGSQQRAISLDLLATGITSGVWEDESVAIEQIKAYWKWFKQETEKNAGLGGLLKDYINQEEANAKNGGRPLQIHTHELRNRVDNWVTQGWLFEKPKSAQVKEMMLDLGMRLQQGIWRKN